MNFSLGYMIFTSFRRCLVNQTKIELGGFVLFSSDERNDDLDVSNASIALITELFEKCKYKFKCFCNIDLMLTVIYYFELRSDASQQHREITSENSLFLPTRSCCRSDARLHPQERSPLRCFQGRSYNRSQAHRRALSSCTSYFIFCYQVKLLLF